MSGDEPSRSGVVVARRRELRERFGRAVEVDGFEWSVQDEPRLLGTGNYGDVVELVRMDAVAYRWYAEDDLAAILDASTGDNPDPIVSGVSSRALKYAFEEANV